MVKFMNQLLALEVEEPTHYNLTGRLVHEDLEDEVVKLLQAMFDSGENEIRIVAHTLYTVSRSKQVDEDLFNCIQIIQVFDNRGMGDASVDDSIQAFLKAYVAAVEEVPGNLLDRGSVEKLAEVRAEKLAEELSTLGDKHAPAVFLQAFMSKAPALQGTAMVLGAVKDDPKVILTNLMDAISQRMLDDAINQFPPLLAALRLYVVKVATEKS